MLDLFAGGGGGWDLAARDLGLPSVGIEWDGPACGTRAVVGLATIRADVSTYPAEVFAGKVDGLCGSPPCQSFSSAGKRAGLDDPRGQMVYEPMRYVRAIRPRWVALEQVPEVLGYWRWIARELATMGYSTWAGVLNAADYGVPQVRKRAILLASLDLAVQPPAPTHSRHGHDDLFGGGLAKWVTMAEALGWGLTERPAYTLCGDSGKSGGGHHDGGSRQREEIAKHQAAGKWKLRTQTNTGGSSQHPEDRQPYECDLDRPAPTILNNSVGRWTLNAGQSPSAGCLNRPMDQPSRTVTAGAGSKTPWTWCWERPATTVAADARVFGPHSGGNGDSHSSNAMPVEPWELGVLQGFPADHPWQPPRVSAQIGNAIPPPLALACLSAVTGRIMEAAA